jgi:diguanylate cyclase (GGDEF)-like protein
VRHQTLKLEVPPLRVDELACLHVLRRVPLESVWGMLQHCKLRHCGAGETVLRGGQANQTLFLILDGLLSVHLDPDDSEPVALLPAGETVGEISVIDEHPVSASVRAARPSRLLAVDEDTFWRMTQASHAFAANMLLLLAQRMRANNFRIVESLRLREKLERDATVDGLTGVCNRRWLDERLPRYLTRHQRDARPFSLLMIDVDYFKRFNDSYGHAAGDQALVMVAATLTRNLRPSDEVVRYGGEEFAVLLPGIDTSGAVTTAERLRLAVSRAKLTLEGEPAAPPTMLPPITISIGVASLAAGDDARALLGRADEALYRAKQGGRDRVVVG